jgi:transcriptional regulator with XRE-family HTH domain
MILSDVGRKSRSKESTTLARDFGQRLRKLREDGSLSQRNLAERLGFETAQISRYERGVVMPNAKNLVDLAGFLRVGVAKLLLGEEDGADSSAPIHDLSLLERFRHLEKLNRKDRGIVIALIDALIDSRHLAQPLTDAPVLPPRGDRSEGKGIRKRRPRATLSGNEGRSSCSQRRTTA